MPPDIDGILPRAEKAIASSRTPHELDQARSALVGKKGALTLEMRKLGSMPADGRREAGARLNRVREELEGMLARRKAELADEALGRRMAGEAVDTTLPGRREAQGAVHPLTQTLERLRAIFQTIGFDVADGPEIESDLNNFTLLNHPEDHPARSAHDTFYISGHPGHLLRTHTSPVQVRYAKDHPPPFRVIAPGKVYRVDHDATHSPMFHQVEGMWVDERVRFSDLKGVLVEFFRLFFEDDRLGIRFRPSYFPFTEPSAEFDIRWGDRWLEVCGCGMTHPNVLRAAGIDPGRHQGFAFGVGIERLAMLRHGIDDIRLFFENDARFLALFGRR